MQKTTSYSQFSSKILAGFMAALLTCFSLAPAALAAEETAPAPSEVTQTTDDTERTNGEIFDGKILWKVVLPSKSFVYDGEAHSIFDEEESKSTAQTPSNEATDSKQPSSEQKDSSDTDSLAGEEDSSRDAAETDESQGTTDTANEEASDESPAPSDSNNEANENTGAVTGSGSAESSDEAEDNAANEVAVEGEEPESEDATTDDESNAASEEGNEKAEVVVEVEGAVDEAPIYPVLSMISPDEFSFTYEGENYKVTGLTVEEVTRTDIGTSEYKAEGVPQIFNSEGVDVSAEFTLDILPGTLTIEQRSLILVSDSLIKTYEPGVALVDESGKVSVEGDGFLPGDGATFTFTGSQEEVGSSLNTFTYEFNEGTDAGVYKVTEKPGTLRVTALDFDEIVPITVEAITETVLYDGQPHYMIDYATSTFSLDDREEVYTVTAADEDAVVATESGEYSFEPMGPFTVTDSYGNDVSPWFDVTWEPITLVIEPRTMYLKVNDQTKLYGEEDPSFTYQFLPGDEENDYADHLADEDDLGEISLSREEGEAVGDYAIIAEYSENDNYDVTVEEGTLSITAAKIEVDVESAYVTYDGEPHSVTVNCDLPDVMVLFKTPESDWGEENPAYTEIGTYPVYVQILPTADNAGNTASDVVEAEVVITSDEPAATEDPEETQEPDKTDDSANENFADNASNANAKDTEEPQGPRSPEEDPDFAEPAPSTTVPTNAVDTPETTLPEDLPTVDVNVNDLTIPETAETEVPSNDITVPENELADDEPVDSELLATTSSNDGVGAGNTNKAQSSETVPMTVAETSSNPFGGIFGIVAVGIIVLAICGIGAAIYLWRTKESDE